MDYKPAIRRAVKDCSDRGLYAASKWVAEFLLEYPTPPHAQPRGGFISSERMRASAPGSSAFGGVPGLPSGNPFPGIVDEEMSQQEEDLFSIARAHYDAKEHERVDYLLRYSTHPKARFLGLYCKYLSSEKKSHDVWMSRKEVKPDNRKSDTRPAAPINTDLMAILDLLRDVTDPFLVFLKSIVLKGLFRKAEALECAILSLKAYPWNWSCWKLLWNIVDDHDVVDRLRPVLPEHPMTKIFIIGVMIESHAMTLEIEEDLEDMVSIFPHSLHLRTLQALYAYSIRDYDTALKMFNDMREVDPYRTDEVDTYSNILYTMKRQADLSQLAQHFMAVNKDRPEVSLVIGNYYSLRNEHEKAVKYYQRSVQLDPTYGAAWTLMGHEYLEMKNSHAAIEAYRRGIDINKKDYRAWHGLGQAYELLDMPQYTLHYFQRSTALRPYDVRMWRALGKTYQNLHRYREAIECQKRALIGADKTDTYSHQALAELYEILGELAEAAAHHRRCVEISVRAGAPVYQYSKSSIQVARYEMSKYTRDTDAGIALFGPTASTNGQGGPPSEANLSLAREYLEKVATSNTAEVREAEELLRALKLIEDDNLTTK